jgi:hypothetical protein
VRIQSPNGLKADWPNGTYKTFDWIKENFNREMDPMLIRLMGLTSDLIG